MSCFRIKIFAQAFYVLHDATANSTDYDPVSWVNI